MRPRERIPQHGHSNRDDGGLIAGSTVVTLTGGATGGTTGSTFSGAAIDVSVADVAGLLAASNAEAAFAELATDADAHLADTTAAHAASATSFDPTGLTSTDATDVQGAIADHDAALAAITPGPDVDLVTVAAAGATETIDVSAARTYDVTLTADCTVTLTGAVTAEAWYLTVAYRQDGTGGWTVTHPGSVVWPSGTAPTIDPDPAAVTFVTYATFDGGTVWFGFPVGGSTTPGASALDDLTDVTITTPAEGHNIRYRSGVWVNEAFPSSARWELVVTGSSPPVAMTTDDGTDFLYSEV